jgi:hypothetical protein
MHTQTNYKKNVYFYDELSKFDCMKNARFSATIDGDPKLKDLKRIYTAFMFSNIFKFDAGNNK